MQQRATSSRSSTFPRPIPHLPARVQDSPTSSARETSALCLFPVVPLAGAPPPWRPRAGPRGQALLASGFPTEDGEMPGVEGRRGTPGVAPLPPSSALASPSSMVVFSASSLFCKDDVTKKKVGLKITRLTDIQEEIVPKATVVTMKTRFHVRRNAQGQRHINTCAEHNVCCRCKIYL